MRCISKWTMVNGMARPLAAGRPGITSAVTQEWLARIYPHLLAAARWIHYHREETQFEDADIPQAAKPIRRQIPWSCRPEPDPPRKPGEKPYWAGLLPWSYGDSGLPEGHAFAHNYFALYA